MNTYWLPLFLQKTNSESGTLALPGKSRQWRSGREQWYSCAERIATRFSLRGSDSSVMIFFCNGFPPWKAVFPRNGKPVVRRGRKAMGPVEISGSPGYRKEQAMSRFLHAVASFLSREDGPTAVEYAVMLALIIVVCIAAITTLGSNANQTFTSVANTIGGTAS